MGVSGPYEGAFRNGPQKTVKNGLFWVFFVKIFILMRSQHLKFVGGNSSWSKRLNQKESWCWVLVGVPKKAQKGPVNQKNISFLFIKILKMLGISQNLKCNFLFNATTSMQNFVAFNEQLHRVKWLKKTKIAPKKSRFWVLSYKNPISRSLNPKTFFEVIFATSVEVPEKISANISQKWLRYDCPKWHGKY